MKTTMNTSQTNAFAHAVAHLTEGIYSLDWADVRNDITEEGSVIAEIHVSMPDTDHQRGYRFFIASDGTMSKRDYSGNRVTLDFVDLYSDARTYWNL